MRFLALCLAFLLASLPAGAQSPEASGGTPLDGLLREDGSLDLDRARGAGSLDLSGFDVEMTDDGLRAVPQVPGAARSSASWDAVGNVGSPPIDGTVRALAVAPDGTIYAGGSFDTVNGLTASGVAAYDSNTGTWSALGTGVSVVYALTLSPGGILYVGGSFSTAGGISASRVAAYDTNTGTWSALGTGVSSSVYALALSPGGVLYVGGAFSTAGGISASRVAAYDTNTSTWSALGTGVSSTVWALELSASGTLYVGGRFTAAGGSPANRIAAYVPGTGTWSALGGGMDSDVNALEISPAGLLYVGGQFTTADGTPADRLAAYDTGTGTWTPLSLPVDNSLEEIEALLLDGSTLYAGGDFSGTDLLNEPYNVGAYDTGTDTWSTLGTGLPQRVWALALSGTDLVAGGEGPSNEGLLVDWDGTAWSSVGPASWDASIEQVAVAPDGTLYAAGGFFLTPDGTAHGLAQFDGTTWSAVGDPALIVTVFDMEIASDGTVYLTGILVTSDAPSVVTLAAAWDGTAWESILDLTSGGDGLARALTIGSDGTVYIAEQRSSGTLSRVYTWDGSTLSAFGADLPWTLTDLLEASDGTLYAGGIGPTNAVFYEWTGSAWADRSAGLVGPDIFDLVEAPDGDILVGGSLTEAGGSPAVGVAAWNGTSWAPVGTGIVGTVFVLSVDPLGTLYAGGQLLNASGTAPQDHIVVYDDVAGTWSPVGGGVARASQPFVRDIAFSPNGDLIASGQFDSADGVPVSNIAAYSLPIGPPLPTADAWSAVGSGTTSSVWSAAVAPDGTLYVGGTFTSIGGISASRVAAWDGAAWSALGSGVNSTVQSLDVGPDGTLYAGGNFTSAGGASASRVASWNGTAWTSLSTTANGAVADVELAPDGTLYVGGSFTSLGGISASHIAALDTDSGTWSALGTGLDEAVWDVAIGPDGTVYAAGAFANAGGVAAARIAAWDGTAWSPLGSGLNNLAYTVIAGADGTVYAGGLFTTAGGAPAARVAAWDGAAWSPLGAGTNGIVFQLLLDPQGALYAAGAFTTADGNPANRIARWDGSTWNPLGSGVDSFVRDVVHDRASGLYVAGDFATAGGLAASGVARWQAPLAITLDGAEGWRMFGAPALAMSLSDLLEPIWTQGMPGSDAPGADPDQFCNVFVHDETIRTDTNNDGVVSTADGWTCIPSLAGISQPGQGVLVYVFADDDNDGTPEAFPKTLPLTTGVNPTALLPYDAPEISYTDSPLLPDIQEGFNYVANPTPLALDADLFAATNLAATTYVWDATLFGGDYRTWNGAAGELTNGIVPPAQGFFVQASGAAPSLSIPAAATRTSGVPYYGRSAPPVLRFELARVVDGTPTPEASAFLHLDASGDAGIDRLDGLRLTPLRWPYATLYTQASGDASALVVNALPASLESAEVPLGVATAGLGGSQAMTLSWGGFPSLPAGMQAVLVDTETGDQIDLVEPGSYTFTLSSGARGEEAPPALSLRPDLLPTALARGGGTRFLVRLGSSVVSSEGASPEAFALDAPYPNPTRGAVMLPYALEASGAVRIAVYDALGREVAVVVDETQAAGRHRATLDASSLASGVYVVRLTSTGAETVSAVRRLNVVR